MEYYSVSRLKTYKTCSIKYKYEYVEKDKIYSASKSTIIGSIVHNALEIYYLLDKKDRQPLINYFNAAFNLYVKESRLDKTIDETVVSLLERYSKDMGRLIERSSPFYRGKDAIRKKDGSPASNPQMTSDWKLSYESSGLSSLHDSLLMYLNGSLDMEGSDFINAYSEAKYLCSSYKGSSWLDNSIEVEMPISKKNSDGSILNPVLMPSKHGGRKNIYLLGFIDLVSKLDDGSLLLVDHKTSSSSFTGSDVSYNAQLLSYAYAYEKIKGVRPHYIGINNIRDDEVVFVETPSSKEAMEVLDSLFSCHKLINDEVWIKHSPEPYSPCVSMYGSTCPYLNKCWPNYLP